MTTVLIADDQPMQRFGFRMLLESQDDMTVVGEAANGHELQAEIDKLVMRYRDRLHDPAARPADAGPVEVVILTHPFA